MISSSAAADWIATAMAVVFVARAAMVRYVVDLSIRVSDDEITGGDGAGGLELQNAASTDQGDRYRSTDLCRGRIF